MSDRWTHGRTNARTYTHSTTFAICRSSQAHRKRARNAVLKTLFKYLKDKENDKETPYLF